MPSPLPAAPRQSRTEILNAAAHLFRTGGFAAVSMRDIADRVGIKTASLYHHFAAKDDIVLEVLNRGMQGVIDEAAADLARLPAGAGAARRIRTLIGAQLRAQHDLGDYTAAYIRVISEVPDAVREATKPLTRSYIATWRELFRAGQESGELRRDLNVRLAIGTIMGALNWTTISLLVARGTSTQQVADEISRIILGGLLAPATSTE